MTVLDREKLQLALILSTVSRYDILYFTLVFTYSPAHGHSGESIKFQFFHHYVRILEIKIVPQQDIFEHCQIYFEELL